MLRNVITWIEKASSVLEYARTQAPTTLQGAFFTKFGKKAPSKKQVRIWHKKIKKGLFKQT